MSLFSAKFMALLISETSSLLIFNSNFILYTTLNCKVEEMYTEAAKTNANLERLNHDSLHLRT
ncbi:hypothetical protein DFR28_1078 [Arenicella xantha]|uniref:Uncharacterized protein n=1 Tax=Arenicella xantha TaxID=644221 RepID=A0A395JL01_9GAMM|nr:hypothetical protein DFR28_1078 [Arenicella xantha]